jgi:DNA-binding NtrC family response regulator
MGPDKGRVDAQTLLASELCLAELVGRDAAFLRAVEQTPTFAATNAPVLITGETGTGKELFARAIHALSKRRHGPFIPVDCAGLPEQLAENELFGHSRGAFTDAHAPQRGLAALAEGGTLFLDEIDALSLANQAKLLRFLQEGTYRALGAESFTRADVRVIAATNRNIEDCVERREFRSDLYFRINVLRLHLPPLRERRGDIVLLARSFLASHSDKGEGARKVFSVAALRKLESYRWPGNLRELFNTVQRAFVTCPGREIFPRHVALPNDAKEPRGNAHFRTAKAEAISSFEKTYIAEVLAACGGNISRAAREAGKERRAFGRLVKKYGLRDPNSQHFSMDLRRASGCFATHLPRSFRPRSSSTSPRWHGLYACAAMVVNVLVLRRRRKRPLAKQILQAEERVARQILSYFLRNPRAADSLEGIARWRLLDEMVHRSLEETEEALSWLVAKGYLEEISTLSSSKVFRLNSDKYDEVVRFVKAARKAARRRRGDNPSSAPAAHRRMRRRPDDA